MSHDERSASPFHALYIRFSVLLLIAAAWLLPASLRAQVSFTGSPTTVSSGYNQPTGVAVDSGGNVYFIVYGGNQQLKETLQPDGTFVQSTLPAPGDGFAFPWGVAVDSLGNVYIPNTLHNSVVELTPSGGSYTASTLTLNAGVSTTGIAVDSSGNLYVASAGSNAVYLETPAGGGTYTQSTIASGLGSGGPYGVAVDTLGDVYIADTGDNQVLIETPAGGGTWTQTTIGSGLSSPAGVAVDALGNVYISDSGNNRILKETLSSGSYTQTTLGSGFNNPQSLALDSNGNLYIADDFGGIIVELHVSNVPFGSEPVGSTSSAQTLNFFIPNGTTVGSIGILTTGVSGKDFADAGSSTCTAGTYSSDTNCVVNVSFSPLAAGLRRGAVVLYDGSGNVLSSVPIYGVGTGPQVAFGPGVVQTPVAGLNNPIGLAVDASGNLFVADENNNAVKEILAAGGYTTVNTLAGTYTTGGGFNQPTSVAVDGAGNVFVADSQNETVKEILAAGGYTTVNTLASGFNYVWGIAVDGAGNVFVSDVYAGVVQELPAATGYTTLTTLSGYSGSPKGLTVDSSGNVFVADVSANSIVEIQASGGYTTSTTVATGFNNPTAVALDASGNLYVADTNNLLVKEVLAVGGYSTVKTLGSTYSYPQGVALDATGNVFFTDTGNGNIDELDVADPPSLNFASTTVGSTSSDSPQTIAVANIGNQALTFSGLSYPTDFPAGTGDSSACSGTTSLNAGQQCDLPIDFSPLSAAALSESVTLTDNALNTTGAIQSIGVNGTGLAQVATHFSVSSPGSVISGVGFSITVTALDASNHTVSGYTGPVQFSSTDPGASLPANSALSGGTGSFLVALATLGSESITVADASNASISGTAGFTVVPGPATHFGVVAPSAVNGGQSFNFAVTAYDAFNNVASGYAGTVNFSSTDSSAILPASTTLTSGTGTFSASMITAGSQTITATDSVTSGITGTSNSIAVTIPNLVVTTANDDGGVPENCTPQTTPEVGTDPACSLRDALSFAGANGSATISFDSTTFSNSKTAAQNTITLTNDVLFVPSNVSINGPTTGSGASQANLLTISGGNVSNVFSVNTNIANAKINWLHITGGASNYGGAIVNSGTLNISYCTISGNSTSGGQGSDVYAGGIFNGYTGNLTLNDTTVSGNSSVSNGSGSAAAGGGITNAGTMTLNGSTISGNTATSTGGSGFGSGIYNTGTLTVTDSTISGNTASSAGGGILSSGTVTLNNSTISNNNADNAGGLYVYFSVAGITNSIVSGNSGSINADLFNEGGTLNEIGGNQIGVTGINLAPLANYGGATQTQIPLPGSPAICGGLSSNLGGLTTDQRGFALDGNCTSDAVDAGAVQTNYALTFSTEPPASAFVNQPISPAPVVQLTENGAVATAASTSVSMSDSATLLGGTDSANLSSGQASFGNLLVTSATGSDTLTATLALSSTINLTATSTSFAVTKTTPSITWPTPSPITYGTALSGTQLNASTTVAGTFVYTPAAGTVLGAGLQTLGVVFTPTDTTDYTTASSSVQLTVNQATPSITWPTPSPITYGTALSGTQLNASSTVAGAFVYTPAAGAVLGAGSQTLGVLFTPTDTTDYTTASSSVQLTVNQATPSITWPTPSPITYGTALSGTQLNASSTVAGAFVYTPAAGTVLGAGSQTLGVLFTPTDTTDYTTASSSVQLTVNQATPSITWPSPSPITYGTALSGTQLNASSTVAGAFVYTPAAGAVLGAGSQTLGVLFTPTDTTDYTTASSSVQLTVNQATPSITWPTPSPITYGTALSGTQLNASSTVAGAFVYTPAAGTVLGAGSQTLGVVFTPTDTTDYTTASSSVQLAVNQATPSINWTQPSPIFYGTALSAAQLDATASVPGGFVYSPAAGAVLGAGSQTLGVLFTPTDSTDYKSVPASVTLQVNQPASLTSPTPGSILPGSTVTFNWTAGTGATAYFLSLGTNGPGSANLYESGSITATTVTAKGLPTNGTTMNATLFSMINGVWKPVYYTFTEPQLAALTSPTPGSILPGSTVTFNWTAGTGVSAYFLSLGTNGPGSANLYQSGSVTTTSVTAKGLPINGATVNATLFSMVDGVWQPVYYTFTEPQPAALTSPTPSSILPGSTVTFNWTAGTGVTAYFLSLGTNGPGSANLYQSGSVTTTSVIAKNLPTNGVAINATLFSMINGIWQPVYYTFTEPQAAALTSPTPSSILPGSTVTFNWTAGTGVTAYFLSLGTNGPGSANLYQSGSVTTTSVIAKNLPTNGVAINATLFSMINGIWQPVYYTFTEPQPAALTSPTPSSILPGSTVTFNWTTGTGATAYFLSLGTNGPGSANLYQSGSITATTITARNLPLNGVTINATLFSMIGGVWQPIYYTFTEPQLAALTSPAPGSTLTGSTVTFNWTAGVGATAYFLSLGTNGPGSANLYESGSTTAQTVTAKNLPTAGATVNATLFTMINGVWERAYYTYTEATTP